MGAVSAFTLQQGTTTVMMNLWKVPTFRSTLNLGSTLVIFIHRDTI